MKEKRKNEPNKPDGEARNGLIALGAVIGFFVLVPVVCIYAYLSLWIIEERVQVWQAQQAIREQCNLSDYQPFGYYYSNDPYFYYHDYLPDENLQIECEDGLQSTDWQCTCTKQD